MCRSSDAILPAPQRNQVAARFRVRSMVVVCSISGRPRWCWQRLFQLGRCSASNSATIPLFLMLTFAGRSNLVCRPFSISGRAPARKTARSSRANPTRKRVFGGARPPSSPVRCRTCAHPALVAHTDRVLFERAQDRARAVLKLWPRSRRLRTSTAPAPHSQQRMFSRERPQ